VAEYADVPPDFDPLFRAAEKYVSDYFQAKTENPHQAEIQIRGERYILVRAEGFCHEFIAALSEIYSDVSVDDAMVLARGVLYDLAYAMGMADARIFHKATGVNDPIEKLSTGPIHFAFTGWGRVKILDDSSPSADEDFVLHYEHPNSFESATWLKTRRDSVTPVCFMNAGYSAGWCTVSFGIPLMAVEITCRAAGDQHCSFVMAHREHLHEKLENFLSETVHHPPEITPFMNRVDDLRRQLGETRREAMIHLLANEGSGEGVVIFDEKVRIAYVNRTTLELFGYSEKELIGAGAEKLVRAECLDAINNNVTWTGNLLLKRKTGSSFPCHVIANPIMDTENKQIGYYLICRDTTRLIEAERKRRRAEQKLQEANRDHSLALAHATRLAAMGEMSAVMAHELNQPLGGIKNYLQGCLQEIQQAEPDTESLRRALQETSRLVDKAGGIIKRLRIFASPGEGNVENISIRKVINDVVDLLRPRFRRNHIDVTVSLPETDPPILGDPLRIEQVLLNLVVNACDALKEAEVKNLEIAVKVRADDTVEIGIADSGTGIPKKDHDKIFDPFFTTKKESLGLGLSISHTIIREHGGKIRTSSDASGGTNMIVLLPTSGGADRKEVKISEES